jgi:hypothetical protein
VAFELDSPERESGEGSTTPCGVKGVVGPGSRAQIRLAVEKTECPLQRTTTLLPCSLPGPCARIPAKCPQVIVFAFTWDFGLKFLRPEWAPSCARAPTHMMRFRRELAVPFVVG